MAFFGQEAGGRGWRELSGVWGHDSDDGAFRDRLSAFIAPIVCPIPVLWSPNADMSQLFLSNPVDFAKVRRVV